MTSQSSDLRRTASEVESEVESRIETTVAARIANELPSDGNIMSVSYRSGPGSDGKPVNSDVSVRLVGNESARFYVMGEVTVPGSYALAGNETVLDAIITAGGVTSKANEHKVILVRPADDGRKTVLPVCFQSIVQLGETSTNYQIQPGDRIYVPSLSLLEDVRQSLRWNDGTGCPHCKR